MLQSDLNIHVPFAYSFTKNKKDIETISNIVNHAFMVILQCQSLQNFHNILHIIIKSQKSIFIGIFIIRIINHPVSLKNKIATDIKVHTFQYGLHLFEEVTNIRFT